MCFLFLKQKVIDTRKYDLTHLTHSLVYSSAPQFRWNQEPWQTQNNCGRQVSYPPNSFLCPQGPQRDDISQPPFQQGLFISVHFLSRVRLFETPWTACSSNSCPSSRWCHPTISSSVVPFPSCLQSFPASGSFLMSQLFASVAKVLELKLSISLSNESSGLISFRINWFDLLSVQGTLRVFSNTTVQKHQFLGAQFSLWSNSHIHTWPLEKLWLWLDGPLSAK